jgi:hypothetical protein
MISTRSNVNCSNFQEDGITLELSAMRINRPNYDLTFQDECDDVVISSPGIRTHRPKFALFQGETNHPLRQEFQAGSGAHPSSCSVGAEGPSCEYGHIKTLV